MTRPTNILLDESSRAVARRRAAERGLSVSGYVRELIRADDAATGADSGDLSALIGILGSGRAWSCVPCRTGYAKTHN